MKIDRSVSLILTIAVGLIVGYMMTRFLIYFPKGSQLTPTVLLAAVSAPVVYLWQCVLKLNELKKITGLNKNEFRRLMPKIKASKAFYLIKMWIIIISNILIGLAFFLAPSTFTLFSIPIIHYAVASLGFMAVFAAQTLLECHSELGKIHDFEIKIEKRENDRKRVSEALASLAHQQPK